MGRLDKQTFLNILELKLSELKVPADDIDKHIGMLDRYLSFLPPEDCQNEVDSMSDVDSIAMNIYMLIQKKNTQPQPLPKQEIQRQQPPENSVRCEEAPTKTMSLIPSQSKPAKPEYDEGNGYISFEDLDELPEENVKASPAFWAIFLLTLPLTIPICFAGIFLFFIAIVAMSLIIVGLVALLIAEIAAGTGLSLIGIIYGITQTFTSVPIGLYEIGLGILIGGAAMFAGILIYNLAVRFFPFAIKQTLAFFLYSLRQLKKLFIHLKKESVKS